MSHLLEDWLSHGPGVLARVRENDPSTYLRVAFSTIPKGVQIAIESRGPMDSNEMRLLRPGRHDRCHWRGRRCGFGNRVGLDGGRSASAVSCAGRADCQRIALTMMNAMPLKTETAMNVPATKSQILSMGYLLLAPHGCPSIIGCYLFFL
jgi:hypothetical protein